jgi:DNA topoisomerase VI subunit B
MAIEEVEARRPGMALIGIRRDTKDLTPPHAPRETAGGSTVRELVSEFRGLSSTAKQTQTTGDLVGVYLHDLVSKGDIDRTQVERLLETMKRVSSLPKPSTLGIIGQDHLKKWMVRYANVPEQSVRYRKRMGENGLPHVLEVAFGIRKEGERRIVTGLNWAPTLVLPTEELSSPFGQMRIDRDDPVTVIVHIARPRFEFVDRGKTRMEL